jgi:hypothetical protein
MVLARRVVAVGGEQAVARVEARVERDPRAVVETRAGLEIDGRLAVRSAFGAAVLRLHAQPLVVVLENGVHHTRHRVGAVDGRCAVAQHLDAL